MARVRVPVTVRWSDMDAYGHVNNVQSLRLLEEVRVRAFEALPSEGPGLLRSGVVVARHEVEYLRPLTWRLDPVPVDLWVTAIGGASFDLGYEVFDEVAGGPDGPGEGLPGDRRPGEGLPGEGGPDGGRSRHTYVRAATTVVPFDAASGRPRRLGEHEREVLEAWRSAPVAFRRRGRP